MQRDPAQPTQMEIRATRLVGQICLGLFLVALFMIVKSLAFQEVSYLGEDGKNIGLRLSLEEATAPKIRFRGKVYITPAGEEFALKRTGAFTVPDGFHTYAKLPDGRILIAGKNEDFFDMTDGTWIFDPKRGKKIDGPKMNAKCINPTLTTLRDGKVLFTGGFRDKNTGPINIISILDPSTNRITQIGKLQYPRAEHTCLQINDHEVVVAGGRLNEWTVGPGDYTGTIELIDLSTGKSYMIQTSEKGGNPIVIRDDKKDIYVIGGYYSAKAGMSLRWHSKVTRLNIPREDVD